MPMFLGWGYNVFYFFMPSKHAVIIRLLVSGMLTAVIMPSLCISPLSTVLAALESPQQYQTYLLGSKSQA